MVRYLAGELRLPAGEIDRTLTAFQDYLATAPAGEDGAVDLGQTVRRVVEVTMVPGPHVEQILVALLALSTRLDRALGPQT
jgi:hypothetical protein